MIALLIHLLIAFLIVGLIWWAVSLLPLPAPFKTIVQVVVIVICILILIQSLGGIGSLGLG